MLAAIISMGQAKMPSSRNYKLRGELSTRMAGSIARANKTGTCCTLQHDQRRVGPEWSGVACE